MGHGLEKQQKEGRLKKNISAQLKIQWVRGVLYFYTQGAVNYSLALIHQ
jgi:hypothetical protein